MAHGQQLEQLQKGIDDLLAYDRDDLRNRGEWGTFDFEDAEHDLQRIFSIAGHLKPLPLQHLPDDTTKTIQQQVTAVMATLKSMDDFSVEMDNAKGSRVALVAQVHTVAEQFYKIVTPWIPFLAYQKGDVAKNIASLTKSVKDGEKLVEEAKKRLLERDAEMKGIIEKAREASAAAGAAVFTQDFLTSAETLKKSARWWLLTTALLGLITAATALIFWWVADPNLGDAALIQQTGSKLFFFAVLLTSTLWCGRNYKALMHQSTLDRHRSLALQTFQAFSAAASDDQTKNAVLLEATHSIFATSSTGYLDGKSTPQDPATKIVAIVKSVAGGE